MASKPVGGFTLELGKLYNDGWFNSATPQHHSGALCPKCKTPVTIHQLEKIIFAFGNVITKNCTVDTCPECLHEQVFANKESKKKLTKPNLAKIFSKLPKEVQISILKGAK